jgi:glycosyltransferase involved in cell wall biosynthesis
VPIGIIQEPPKASAEHLRAAVDRLGVRKKLVFSLGRLVPYKGFDHLVAAARHLPDNVVVAIGGQGPQEETLRALVHQYHLEGKLILLGKLSEPEVAAYMELADVFCLPSINRAEAFGVVLLEALRAGKPIVTTEIPGSGVPWVNEHGTTGLNVEPKNPAALASAIEEILNNASLQQRFSFAARARFQSLFTRERMVADTLKIYGNLA